MLVNKTTKPHLVIELQGYEEIAMMQIIVAGFVELMNTKQTFESEEHREWSQKAIPLAEKIDYEIHR
jgi:hypothetical protein